MSRSTGTARSLLRTVAASWPRPNDKIREANGVRLRQLRFRAAHQFKITVMGASLVSEDAADEIRKRWPSGEMS